jgi:predicted nucleic acid-binding protein
VIAYVDASALVKRYIVERRSRETMAFIADADIVATSIVSRAEVSAAFARAARTKVVTVETARRAQRAFAADWPDLARVPITEALAERAEALAWRYRLRGYDALQLASALTWQDSVAAGLLIATFDAELWAAASAAGLKAWPDNLVKSH